MYSTYKFKLFICTNNQAGDLFSLEDQYIVADLEEVLETIQEIITQVIRL